MPIANPFSWPVLRSTEKRKIELSHMQLGDDILSVDIPGKDSRHFKIIRCEGGPRNLSLLKEETETASDTMFYFDQYDGVIHPTHEGFILSAMFYVSSEEANANPSVYEAVHVSQLDGVDWTLVAKVWLSRCGRTHILYMKGDLVMTLLDITDSSPFRKQTALPQVCVDTATVENATRLFMTHQGPSGDTSMIWDQNRSSKRLEFLPWKDFTDTGDGDVRMMYSILAHYDTCHLPRHFGPADWFNRVSQGRSDLFKLGQELLLDGYKNNLYTFLFAGAMKPDVKVMANIHLLTFLLYEVEAKCLIPAQFHKMSAVTPSSARLSADELATHMTAMDEQLVIYINKCRDKNQLVRLSPLKPRKAPEKKSNGTGARTRAKTSSKSTLANMEGQKAVVAALRSELASVKAEVKVAKKDEKASKAAEQRAKQKVADIAAELRKRGEQESSQQDEPPSIEMSSEPISRDDSPDTSIGSIINHDPSQAVRKFLREAFGKKKSKYFSHWGRMLSKFQFYCYDNKVSL